MEKIFWENNESIVLNKDRVIKSNEIAPGIVVYNDVIQDASTLVTDIEEGMQSAKITWSAAYVKDGDESRVNTNSRDTSTISIPYSATLRDNYSNFAAAFTTNLCNLFLENLVPLEKSYQVNYGISCTWHDSYQILKYGVGQKFINHIDDHTDYHRRVSTLYYLNEDYSGGEINFPRFNISIKPKANQMIIFPSTYVYNHSVSPVTEGTRYAVVSWLR